jgi:hypothetical protein
LFLPKKWYVLSLAHTLVMLVSITATLCVEHCNCLTHATTYSALLTQKAETQSANTPFSLGLLLRVYAVFLKCSHPLQALHGRAESEGTTPSTSPAALPEHIVVMDRFVVDSFGRQYPGHIAAFFLTHYHSDHYGGLRASWNR